MKRVAIYTRFSPRRNAGESESCETQESYCREYAESKGYTVIDVFEDKAMSGNDPNRPGLANAISALRRGDVLLAYKPDRIARSVMLSEWTRIKVGNKGATLECVSGDIDGNGDESTMVRQVLAAVAEYERKQIGARTRDAMRRHQKNGKRMSRYAPYGHRVDPLDHKRLVSNPDEQAVIAHIGKQVAKGVNPNAITSRPNAEMPDLSRTGIWNTKTVTKIIRRMETV